MGQPEYIRRLRRSTETLKPIGTFAIKALIKTFAIPKIIATSHADYLADLQAREQAALEELYKLRQERQNHPLASPDDSIEEQ